MKRKLLAVLLCIVGVCLVACAKEDITQQVKLKQEQVEIGTNMKVDDLFECTEGVKIGIKNADAINFNKAGSYSIETTISKEDETVEKDYIIQVSDTEAPKIVLDKENIEIYEGDKFEVDKYVKANDNSGEDIKIDVEVNNVDVNTAGEYKVVYSAKDASDNESTAELAVRVKKEYSYKEMLKVVKGVIQQEKYKNLKISTDSTKKSIWVEYKKGNKVLKKGSDLYSFDPYWSFGKGKKKKWNGSLIVYAWMASKKNYFTPASFYIKSEKGTVDTDSWKRHGTYDSSYVQCYDSDISVFFAKKNSDKVAEILQGSNLSFSMYQEYTQAKYTFKCDKKVIKRMKLLGEFYAELNELL